MSKDNSSRLLIDTPGQSILKGHFVNENEQAKCIIKLDRNIIFDVQETANNIFDCDLSKMIGEPIEAILPEYQPEGNLSKDVFQSILDNMQFGRPINTTLHIKTAANQLHYADANIFSFEKDKYYLTLSPKKFEISSLEQTIDGKEHINIQNLIVDGALMFKCYDIDGSVYYLNSAYLEFTATSFNQQLKEGWLNTVNIADRDRVNKTLFNALNNREKYNISYKLEKADNNFTTVYESGIPIFNRDGKFNGIAAAIIDLVDVESKDESSFLKSKEELNDLTDSAPVLFKMSNSKNEFYYFSNQWINFTGKSLKNQKREGWLSSVFTEDIDTVKSSIEAAFSKRKKYGVVYRIYNHQKQLRWVHEAGIPLYESEGEFSGYISATIDITDKKIEEDERNLQHALQESEKKLHSSLEKSHLIAFSLDKSGKITFCNEALSDVTGKTKDEIVGQYFL